MINTIDNQIRAHNHPVGKKEKIKKEKEGIHKQSLHWLFLVISHFIFVSVELFQTN